MQLPPVIRPQGPGQLLSSSLPNYVNNVPQSVPYHWQSNNDRECRQKLIEHIVKLFQTKRPAVTNDYALKLTDFVRRLEGELYKTARSREEYEDITTLEERLQEAAKRMVGPRQQQNMVASNGQAGVPQMMLNSNEANRHLTSGHQGVPNQLSPAGYPNSMGSNPLLGNPNNYMSGAAAGAMHNTLPNMIPTNMGGAFPHNSIRNGMIFAKPASNGVGHPHPAAVNKVLPPDNGLIPSSFGTHNSFDTSGMNGYNSWGTGPSPVLRHPQRDVQSAAVPPSVTVGPDYAALNQSTLPSTSFNMWQGLSSSVPPRVTIGGHSPAELNNTSLHQQQMQASSFLIPNPGIIPNNSGSGMIPVTSTPSLMPGLPPTSQMPSGPVGPNVVPMNPVNFALPTNSSQFPNSGQFSPTAVPQSQPMLPTGNPSNGQDAVQRHQYVQRQQRWLLFLWHCAKCNTDEANCSLGRNCKVGKDLWHHILTCRNTPCQYPRCVQSRDLLRHHQKCQNPVCPICAPVKEYVKKQPGPSQQGFDISSILAGQSLRPPSLDSTALAPSPSKASSQGTAPISQAGQKRPHAALPAASPSSPGTQTGLSPLQPLKQEVKEEENPAKRVKVECENNGTSLLEAFTADQIERHIELIQSAALTGQKPGQQPQSTNPEDYCKVCKLNKLAFEPRSLYCTACGQKIKRGQTYHCTPLKSDPKGWWCHSCFTDNKGDRLMLEGMSVSKKDLEKKKNDEEVEEGWVACDKCEGWVHQICGLFNKGRNDENTRYLCPECLMDGLKTGTRTRMEERPQAMLEAKDLPRCELSDFIENRMKVALVDERIKRSKVTGMQLHATPEAKGLTVRVVNTVSKKCEVKSKFYETFRDDGYPSEFPYRQKVLLLFQNIDGVDVCLFCMYVQEYGADCPAPNRNCVYLSYLDSVKYFTPEVQAAVGANISLRTYVYHQILIGYLHYVRDLGFEQMYIWACPPLQGDDYILHCHPSRQKTPKSDRLRQWYHEMLRRAAEEGLVDHIATLWDTFFEGGRDHRLDKCSSTHIPYLEGDYWPGEAEHLLANITDTNKNSNKKGGQVRKGGAGSKGKRYGSNPATTDEQLMARMGEILGGNMKEDFIVVHMRPVCSFCRAHPNGEMMYRAPQGGPLKPPPERKFEGIKLESGASPLGTVTRLQICAQCYEEERCRASQNYKSRLPSNLTLADLIPVKAEGWVPKKDVDGDVESEFYDTRQNFLSLCQGNHYQFDTLRRAKHSSMMVLYHLHNPQAPAYACTCNCCSVEIEPGQGFRCTLCNDFDMCNKCKLAGRTHEHPLVPHCRRTDERSHISAEAREAERRERAMQLQRTMQLLVHAVECNPGPDNPCTNTSCRKVRQLFAHAVNCNLKVTGGCQLCRRMWCLLNIHAKSCTRSDCKVPRCRELKDLRRKQNDRKEEQRRASYKAMVRQQAEAAR